MGLDGLGQSRVIKYGSGRTVQLGLIERVQAENWHLHRSSLMKTVVVIKHPPNKVVELVSPTINYFRILIYLSFYIIV